MKPIFIICSIFSSIPLFAQFNLSGNVKDRITQEPLIGVSVYLPELKVGSSSNLDGNFTVQNLKSSDYIIELSYAGYKTITDKISMANDTVIYFFLEPTSTELSEVVVTGVTRVTELKRNPIVVSIMDGSSFRQSSATNLIDALKEIPGVSQITSGPNISKPVIRGLGYNRIITLNNGIKQEGQQWGDEHGIEIDEYAINRAEIVKGPGSLLYGSDGIAGVLNFLPPKPPPIGIVKTQLLTNYQSNNNQIGYSFANAGNKNGLQWIVGFTNKFAANYKNIFDGRVYNSGFKEYDGNASLGVIKKWGHSQISFNSYNTNIGIIDGERDSLGNFVYTNLQNKIIVADKKDLSSYTIKVPYQWVNHQSIAVNNFMVLKKGTLNAEFSFQLNLRREYADFEHPKTTGLFLLLNTLNYNLRYNLENKKGWETTVGTSGTLQFNKNKGTEFLIPNYNSLDLGAFIFTQKTIKKLTVAGGLRFDIIHLNTRQLLLDSSEQPIVIADSSTTLKFAANHKNYFGASGSIGLTYQITKNSTLKFNFSNGFRAPNIAELASNGKHEGTFRYEIGNTKLKPEFSHQLDIDYALNSEHITFEISPFVNFISNYIFLEKQRDSLGNAIFLNPNDSSPTFNYTAGNAILTGGEIYFDFHPHPLDWLHVENSFSYVLGMQIHQSDSTKYLPYLPAPHYRGGVKAQFKTLSKYISDFFVRFNVDYYFAQNKIYSAYHTESKTPGYTLLSAGMGLSFSSSKRKDVFSMYFNAENLANIAYQNHLSRLKYAPENLHTNRVGVFNMGRNFSIKMIVNI
ncbi:MAG: TonB-dependent receptor [Chitinophagales bacterium]